MHFTAKHSGYKVWFKVMAAPVKFSEHLKTISTCLVTLFVFSKQIRSLVSKDILVASHKKTLNTNARAKIYFRFRRVITALSDLSTVCSECFRNVQPETIPATLMLRKNQEWFIWMNIIWLLTLRPPLSYFVLFDFCFNFKAVFVDRFWTVKMYIQACIVLFWTARTFGDIFLDGVNATRNLEAKICLCSEYSGW